MNELSVVEVQRLEALESVIDAGMQTFVHVGNALLEIRDNRLYRRTHRTFEEYCRERWEFSSSRARRLIDAAEVVENLKSVPMGTLLPSVERQARPLTSLPPEQQPAVWQRAVETAPNGKITQAHVQAVVDKHRKAGVAADNNMELIEKEVTHAVMDDINLNPESLQSTQKIIQVIHHYTKEAIKTAMDVAKQEKTQYRAEREQVREMRRQSNANKAAATENPLAVGAKFATILIDPPWDWGDEGDVNQFGRAKPDYATMSFNELQKLPVDELADVDCHLYLWITNRSLPKGFALMESWQFRYITCITWVKPSFGLGNYFRGQTEHILFGVKGSQPLRRNNAGTVFHAARGDGGHSSKPTEVYDLIESCSPGPYLEMFARRHRNGWAAWGADA